MARSREGELRESHLEDCYKYEQVIEEYNVTLLAEKFGPTAPIAMRLKSLLLFLEKCERIEATEKITVCRDADDNKFLEAAVSSNASCIITGDAALLELHPFRDISILTPAAFLNSF